MAAIFGLIGPQSKADQPIERMAASLLHRGDTFNETIESDQGVIGSRRTVPRGSLDRGQPFTAEDRTLHVVMDGVLANVAALRQVLEEMGIAVRTNSDCEVIAGLYRLLGVDCFNRLRGAFAIAIIDEPRKMLLLARDHLGHKPLFYSRTPQGLVFASEIKSILASGLIPFSLDMESLSHFLSLRFLPAPYSLVKGIDKLPPATYFVHRKNEHDMRQYWSISFATKHNLGHDQIIEGLEAKLSETISAYLRHDITTGAFLSGGLDSGLIVANMAAIQKTSFSTFSLGVADGSDEVPLARLVAQKFNTVQHESYPDENLIRLLPAMIWQIDEPSDMVLVSKYLLAQMASSKVSAAISGDGGDELFAGFMRYLGLRDAHYFGLVPSMIRDNLVIPLALAAGGRRGLRSMSGKIHWLAKVTAAGALPERYAEAVEYLRFKKVDKQRLFTADMWRAVADIDSRQLLVEKVRRSDAEDPIEKLLYTDYLTRLPEHLLMIDDRTGAAHGIEIACPLADKELVEYVSAIPANLKIRGRKAKYAERELARKVLPREVVESQKTGWSFPFAELCAGELRGFLHSVFSESRLVRDNVFSQPYMELLLAEHAGGQADHHIRIWMLLSLEIWYRIMVDDLHHSDMLPWIDRHLGRTSSPPS